jgi:hypothetical protein
MEERVIKNYLIDMDGMLVSGRKLIFSGRSGSISLPAIANCRILE